MADFGVSTSDVSKLIFGSGSDKDQAKLSEGSWHSATELELVRASCLLLSRAFAPANWRNLQRCGRTTRRAAGKLPEHTHPDKGTSYLVSTSTSLFVCVCERERERECKRSVRGSKRLKVGRDAREEELAWSVDRRDRR